MTVEYSEATPFPHIVVDDFLPYEMADAALDYFPAVNDQCWYKYDNVFEKKLASNRLELMEMPIRALIDSLNGHEMIRYLEGVTGIDNLIPDPKCRGGGLHCILPGGKLDVHADFNFHPDLKLDRRLNVLIYLNKDWKEEWGGHLELWDKDMQACQKKIAPIFNRMVCFSTTDQAYHGHPEPLRCPDAVSRRSIALYYYTSGRPDSERSTAHSTLYQKRPSDPTTAEIEEMRAQRGKGRLA